MQQQPSRARRWLSVCADLASICSATLLLTLTALVIVSAAIRGAAVPRTQAAQPAAARPPQPPPVAALEASSTVGPNAIRIESAKLALIEFADFQCRYCGIHYRQTLPVLKQEFIDSGDVGYVYRDFPAEGRGPDAIRASLAADCAGRQGQYWEMHDRLFRSQGPRDDLSLIATAQTAALRVPDFKSCMKAGDLSRIRADQAEGRRLGVSATPTFFVGVVESGGRIAIKRQIRGAQGIDVFRNAIRDVRREAGLE